MTGYLNNLIHITRFSGTHLLKSESVSDHVWGMIALAIESLDQINKTRAHYNQDPIDKKELIYKIAIHDIDEAYYCDIPRPFKYHNDRIHTIIDEVSHELMEKHLPSEIVTDIDCAKSTVSAEGIYTKAFDFIQCGLKMVTEVKLGNSIIKHDINNVIESLTELASDLHNNPAEEVFIRMHIDRFKSFLANEYTRLH